MNVSPLLVWLVSIFDQCMAVSVHLIDCSVMVLLMIKFSLIYSELLMILYHFHHCAVSVLIFDRLLEHQTVQRIGRKNINIFISIKHFWRQYKNLFFKIITKNVPFNFRWSCICIEMRPFCR